MPQVKILISEDNGDFDNNSRLLTESITDWEDVSDEDLKLIQQYRWDLQQEIFGKYAYNRYLVVLIKDTEPVTKRISDLKEIVAVKLKKAAADSKRRSEAAKLSKVKREATKRANELAKLKELADRHGVQVEIPSSGSS